MLVNVIFRNNMEYKPHSSHRVERGGHERTLGCHIKSKMMCRNGRVVHNQRAGVWQSRNVEGQTRCCTDRLRLQITTSLIGGRWVGDCDSEE
jgi:hypothetical protein